jgi:hypothetical protein
MTENVVQWVMLRRPEFLAKKLQLPLRRKLAEYQTTDFGVIDFAFDTKDDEIAVVELETEIASTSKLEFCMEQSIRYKQLASQVNHPLRVFILYDQIGTPPRFATRLQTESQKHELELRTYSMPDVKILYQKAMDELERTSGIYLGRPVATNLTHLRLLNRFLMPFVKNGVDVLPLKQLFAEFTSSKSRTIFTVRKNLAVHFELIRLEGSDSGKMVVLTDYGKQFCSSMTSEKLSFGREFDLSFGQRRILLESLTNGCFTKSKVNIYYLLRFIRLYGL